MYEGGSNIVPEHFQHSGEENLIRRLLSGIYLDLEQPMRQTFK